jgi:hypothetical protein
VEIKALGLARTLTLTIVLTTALGCSGEARRDSTPPSTSKSAASLSQQAKRLCPVTVPNGQHPPANADFNHGNGSLWVALWPQGKLLAGTLPDGSSWAEVKPDGSIDAKLGWWRGSSGQLTIRGHRLDASAPPLRANIPHGYGSSGFQATGILFPTEGCWQVTGSVGDNGLTFVTLVVKV